MHNRRTSRLPATSLLLALALVSGFPRFHASLRSEDPGASQTQFFGLSARGSSFVYVIDRSLSMKGKPLAAAKKELVESISRLTACSNSRSSITTSRPN
jgi:hypothetical protein